MTRPGPSPWLTCANYMHAAGIERIVVSLDVHLDEARQDVEWWPIIEARWDHGTDRVRPLPSGLERLAGLAWDAVEAHYRPQDPPRAVVVEALSTSPLGRIREAVACQCDPFNGHCKRCDDTGWVTDTTRAASA
jgi:hypothetical protein